MSPALTFFPEPIRVALDVDRRCMVKDPVEDGRGNHGVVINLVPLAEAALGAVV